LFLHQHLLNISHVVLLGDAGRSSRSFFHSPRMADNVQILTHRNGLLRHESTSGISFLISVSGFAHQWFCAAMGLSEVSILTTEPLFNHAPLLSSHWSARFFLCRRRNVVEISPGSSISMSSPVVRQLAGARSPETSTRHTSGAQSREDPNFALVHRCSAGLRLSGEPT